jgi:hypothetical protein
MFEWGGAAKTTREAPSNILSWSRYLLISAACGLHSLRSITFHDRGSRVKITRGGNKQT